MMALKKILVASDFGDAADAALTYGRELARTFHASLVLLNVADDLLAEAAAYGGYAMDLDTAQKEIAEGARKELDLRLTDEDRRDLHATAVVVTSRSPEWEIIKYAKKHRVDLIVIGTHGRGAMAHFFLGSVAERVVRGAPCPVLTVRHPEHEFVAPDALVAAAKA